MKIVRSIEKWPRIAGAFTSAGSVVERAESSGAGNTVNVTVKTYNKSYTKPR
jgi:hypothetical protein